MKIRTDSPRSKVQLASITEFPKPMHEDHVHRIPDSLIVRYTGFPK